MKEKRLTLHYAVCQYIPSAIAQEKINIGMVFHIPQLSYASVKVIQHAQRIHAFDPRFDLNYLTKLERTFNLLCHGNDTLKPKNLNQDQFLSQWIKADFLGVQKNKQQMLLTKYHFVFLPEQVQETDTEHYQDLMAQLQKMYL